MVIHVKVDVRGSEIGAICIFNSISLYIVCVDAHFKHLTFFSNWSNRVPWVSAVHLDIQEPQE